MPWKISTHGQLAASIDFNMRNIWQTVPDGWTITKKQIYGFVEIIAIHNCGSTLFSS